MIVHLVVQFTYNSKLLTSTRYIIDLYTLVGNGISTSYIVLFTNIPAYNALMYIYCGK